MCILHGKYIQTLSQIDRDSFGILSVWLSPRQTANECVISSTTKLIFFVALIIPFDAYTSAPTFLQKMEYALL